MADHVDEAVKEAKRQLEDRNGWSITIPGKLLPPENVAKRWTPEQRAKGVKLGFFFLLPKEEEEGISNAIKAGTPGAAMVFQAKGSFRKIDGALIEYEDRARAWQDIGTQARNAAINAFSRAIEVSPEDSAAIANSFSLDT